ncbi:MAG: endonuclease/exonuclease/phosphatase family protein [Mycobacterium sp.]|nr:MAG: endonuclease/exonuclease/phosphatase family protein [Mycobacterium sp.]
MVRAVIYLLAWFATVFSIVAVAARYVPVVNHVVLVVAALSPYLTIGASMLAAVLLLSTSPRIAVAALLPAVVAIAIQTPLFISSGAPPPDSVAIRVVSVNVREGLAEPKPLAALARDRADVFVLQELSPELASKLTSLESDFPYRAVDAQPYAAGIGIWSRYPIERSSRDPGYQLGVVTAALRVPGVSVPVSVLVAHLAGPFPQSIDNWKQDIAAFPDTLSDLAAGAGRGSAIVAGDLNATNDMQPFRKLLSGGFHNAAQQSGAGMVRTFPGHGSGPALVGIDHILTLNCSATDMETVPVPGSDHLGVTATIHVPRQVTTG